MTYKEWLKAQATAVWARGGTVTTSVLNALLRMGVDVEQLERAARKEMQ